MGGIQCLNQYWDTSLYVTDLCIYNKERIAKQSMRITINRSDEVLLELAGSAILQGDFAHALPDACQQVVGEPSQSIIVAVIYSFGIQANVLVRRVAPAAAGVSVGELLMEVGEVLGVQALHEIRVALWRGEQERFELQSAGARMAVHLHDHWHLPALCRGDA